MPVITPTMKPYNLAPAAPNPHCRIAGHSRSCAECGIVRPRRLVARKAARQAAQRDMRLHLFG
jgi:hypothetical protein